MHNSAVNTEKNFSVSGDMVPVSYRVLHTDTDNLFFRAAGNVLTDEFKHTEFVQCPFCISEYFQIPGKSLSNTIYADTLYARAFVVTVTSQVFCHATASIEKTPGSVRYRRHLNLRLRNTSAGATAKCACLRL